MNEVEDQKVIVEIVRECELFNLLCNDYKNICKSREFWNNKIY